LALRASRRSIGCSSRDTMRSLAASRSLIGFALASAAVGVDITLVGVLSARISGGGPSLAPPWNMAR
jgi:hypothetical protein